jgi:hypothetical protein
LVIVLVIIRYNNKNYLKLIFSLFLQFQELKVIEPKGT